MHSDTDLKFMRLALLEAEKGLGLVSPNPMVGAVIVKNNRIIGKGFHQKSGEGHAEVNAIKNSIEPTSGSTLYCTLEPCCHTNKKTPPCVPAVIDAGINRVVISNLDPNPNVAGKGIEQLKEFGIEVLKDVLKEEGEKLNEVFFHHILNETPFVHLKAAQTLDGKLQSSSGDSMWISNEDSRIEAHGLRLKYDGVLIGRATLNNDNPELSIRMGLDNKGKVPFRIIYGAPSRFNWDSFLLNSSLEKNIFITDEKLDVLEKYQRDIIEKGKVVVEKDLDKINKSLYEMGIKSYLVEGGSKVLNTFLSKGLFNKLTVFQAPKLLGNGSGIFQSNFQKIKDSLELKITTVDLIDNNIKIEMENSCLQE